MVVQECSKTHPDKFMGWLTDLIECLKEHEMMISFVPPIVANLGAKNPTNAATMYKVLFVLVKKYQTHMYLCMISIYRSCIFIYRFCTCCSSNIVYHSKRSY